MCACVWMHFLHLAYIFRLLFLIPNVSGWTCEHAQKGWRAFVMLRILVTVVLYQINPSPSILILKALLKKKCMLNTNTSEISFIDGEQVVLEDFISFGP